jgi:hypothetical protein
LFAEQTPQIGVYDYTYRDKKVVCAVTGCTVRRFSLIPVKKY